MKPIATRVDASESCLAWLEHEGHRLWARGDVEGPLTSVARLVLGVSLREPRWARKILRERIFHTRGLGPFEWGLVKVAAKRAALASAGPLEGLEITEMPDWSALEARDWIGQVLSTETAAQAAASELEHAAQAARVPHANEDAKRFQWDRAIGAVLVSAQGEVLGAASNRSSVSPLLHAELVCLLGFWSRTQRKLPPGARLYVTLKPCRMCAGLIVAMAGESAPNAVWYRDFDPGPMARATVLDPGSDDRKRFGV